MGKARLEVLDAIRAARSEISSLSRGRLFVDDMHSAMQRGTFSPSIMPTADATITHLSPIPLAADSHVESTYYMSSYSPSRPKCAHDHRGASESAKSELLLDQILSRARREVQGALKNHVGTPMNVGSGSMKAPQRFEEHGISAGGKDNSVLGWEVRRHIFATAAFSTDNILQRNSEKQDAMREKEEEGKIEKRMGPRWEGDHERARERQEIDSIHKNSDHAWERPGIKRYEERHERGGGWEELLAIEKERHQKERDFLLKELGEKDKELADLIQRREEGDSLRAELQGQLTALIEQLAAKELNLNTLQHEVVLMRSSSPETSCHDAKKLLLEANAEALRVKNSTINEMEQMRMAITMKVEATREAEQIKNDANRLKSEAEQIKMDAEEQLCTAKKLLKDAEDKQHSLNIVLKNYLTFFAGNLSLAQLEQCEEMLLQTAQKHHNARNLPECTHYEAMHQQLQSELQQMKQTMLKPQSYTNRIDGCSAATTNAHKPLKIARLSDEGIRSPPCLSPRQVPDILPLPPLALNVCCSAVTARVAAGEENGTGAILQHAPANEQQLVTAAMISKQDEGVTEVQRLRDGEAQLRETIHHLHKDKFPEVSDRQTPTATLNEDPKTSEVNRVKDLQVEVKGPVLAGDLLGTPEMDKGGVEVTISAVVSATSSMKSCLSTPCSSPIGNVKGGGNISCPLGEGQDRKEGAGDDGDMSVKSSATSLVKSGRFTSRSSTAGSTASVTSSWAAKTKVGIGLYFQRSQNGLEVKSIVKGSAADVCGRVAIGDVIVAVNGESVQNASLAELASKVLGETNSIIECSFRRNSQISPASIDGRPAFLTEEGEATEAGFAAQKNFTVSLARAAAIAPRDAAAGSCS